MTSKNSFRNIIKLSIIVWIQIWYHILSDLIWVQTVCKGYAPVICIHAPPTYGDSGGGCMSIGQKPFRRYDKSSHMTFGQCNISSSTTFGRKKQSGMTFGRNCQVIVFRPNVLLDETSLIIKKKENHKKSLCSPEVQLTKARSI